MRPCLVAALLCVASVARAGEPLADLVKRSMPCVVSVVAYIPERAMPSIGTGFFTAPDTVVTARHVLAGVDRAEVRTRGGETIRIAGIAAEDRARDIAVVRLAAPAAGVSALPVSDSLPSPGDRIFTISSPFGLEWCVSEGIVAGIQEVPGAGAAVQHTAAVSPGSSGCPLLDGRGVVVAIQTATITTGDGIVQAGQSLNFASPAMEIPAAHPDKVLPLEDCTKEVPVGWVPPITREIDGIGLRPFTREDYARALAYFEECTKREPGEPDAWMRLGLCRDRTGDLDGALEAYRKAVELKPGFAVAQNNIGVVHVRKGRHVEAVVALREAVRAKPDYVEALSSLAGALIEIGSFGEAEECAERAVRLNPSYAEARYHLGVAAHRLGREDRARAELDALEQLHTGLAEKLKGMLQTRWS